MRTPYRKETMFNFNQPEKTKIDDAIDELLDEMKVFTGDSSEYAKMTDQLTKLHALKQNEKPDRVKPDTLAIIAGNIATALLIIGFEQKHVVTTKVTSFLAKLR